MGQSFGPWLNSGLTMSSWCSPLKMGRMALTAEIFFSSGYMHRDTTQRPACLKAWGFSNGCPGTVTTACAVCLVSLHLGLDLKCLSLMGQGNMLPRVVGGEVTEMLPECETFVSLFWWVFSIQVVRSSASYPGMPSRWTHRPHYKSTDMCFPKSLPLV